MGLNFHGESKLCCFSRIIRYVVETSGQICMRLMVKSSCMIYLLISEPHDYSLSCFSSEFGLGPHNSYRNFEIVCTEDIRNQI